MPRIPEKEREIFEKAIYLPMVLTVLTKDLTVINQSKFKLKTPYIHLIEEAMNLIQTEHMQVKQYMRNNSLKVYEHKRDDAFTMYTFLYKGYEEQHSYFNPRIRNKVQELMEYYLKRIPPLPSPD